MGQVQFMPSSYLQFAEDFDGDGRRDIWSTPADVFASIANYLKGHGWTEGRPGAARSRSRPKPRERIARDVAPRSGTCQATREHDRPAAAERVAASSASGCRTASALPKSDEPASLVSGTTRHFLVYANYDALLDYNCAHSYAISVALLGDAIRIEQGAGGAESRQRRNRSTTRP